MLEVKRILAMTRLLTLTGAGGLGKTRLALEVGRDLVGVYPEGVWLVELAPLTEPELVVPTVARILEVREQPERPLLETLLEALGDKEMLLVVDNCEHLAEAAAHLADALLSVCPKLRILATGRSPWPSKCSARYLCSPCRPPLVENLVEGLPVRAYALRGGPASSIARA